ncbi:hypothetical protein ACP70R_011631 [Stipagrostis hirtigluma subsp. patula]
MAPVSTVGSSRRRAVIVEDPLSSLPDGLIHTIMSFLTPQQAVQTCVLSRRWENLWRSMPYLNIDEQDFDVAESGARVHFEGPSGSYEFNVVDRWLRGGIKGCPAVVEGKSFSQLGGSSTPFIHRSFSRQDPCINC